MNSTRMPGFSAEASLYRSGARFQAGAMFTGVRQAGGVVPSLLPRCSCSGEFCCCDWGSFYCCWGPGPWGHWCTDKAERLP